MKSLKVGRILIKINRLSAWLLLLFMVIFIVSGYAWWNRILLPLQTARYLHTELDLFLVFFFLVHILISIRLTMARWRVGHGSLVNLLLLGLGISSFYLVYSIR